jgi:outer membrane lipoprotein-sorting protein
MLMQPLKTSVQPPYPHYASRRGNHVRLACTAICMMVILAGFCGEASAESADANAMLSGWLNAQTHMQTWSADFTQARTLKSLTQPLIATGHVWFKAPGEFRWEVLKPSPTTAVRNAQELLVFYPRLKRAERYPLEGSQAGQWKDTLALLDAGFPRSRSELEARFNILSQSTANGVHEVALQPKSTTARRIMPEIKIAFDTNDFSLRSTELAFTDGSTMKNVFTNAVMNPKIEDSLFHPQLGSEYKITEPFKK